MLASQRLVRLQGTRDLHQVLDPRWASFFLQLGWLLVPAQTAIPADIQFDTLEASALLLTGGNDLGAVSDSMLSRKRDEADRQLLKAAEERQLPVLGVCRGMQFHVVGRGGQLRRSDAHAGTHHDLVPGLPMPPFDTNDFTRTGVASYHDWTIASLPDHYEVLARADDGSPEAVLDRQRQFLGILWHPERTDPFDTRDLTLVHAFLDEFS